MGHHLLLCADDPDITELLTRALTRGGYDVRLQVNLGAAYWALGTELDMVVVDGSAGSHDGPGVCRQIRDAGASVPVLLLTNRTTGIDHVVAYDSGATTCINKPFHFAELFACLHALLPNPLPGAPLVSTTPHKAAAIEQRHEPTTAPRT